MTRRDLLAAGAASMMAAGAQPADLGSRICVFTDHLAGFPYADVARMFREVGVAGPDLTVRPGGLVLPDRVEEDLPRAAAAFREH